MKVGEEKQLNVPCIVQSEPESTIHDETVPSYGLIVINHAYNEGKLTFKEWLELSRQWAEKIIESNKLSLLESPKAPD
jgi:hypothetical protein